MTTRWRRCSKCGVGGIDPKGIGPHEARCTGDPHRTKRLRARRQEYRDQAKESGRRQPEDEATKARGRKQKQMAGVDLTKLTLDQVLALPELAKEEAMARAPAWFKFGDNGTS